MYDSVLTYLLGIPFALVCAGSFLRGVSVGVVLATISYAAIWPGALWSAVGLNSLWDNPRLAICVAGAIGALGLMAVTAILFSDLIELRYLVAAVVLGAIAAVPLAMNERPNGSLAVPAAVGFAVWQAVVGTYLYAIFRKAKP
jgi:hypothetical protein